MTVTCLAAVAAAATLLIRRNTWRLPGEVGATLAVLQLSLGTWLLSDEYHLGLRAWRATGFAYLDSLAGHLLWLGGLCALLYHAMYRLAERDELADMFDTLVRLPITLIAPLMVSSLLMLTQLHAEPVGDLSDAPPSGWLVAYRTVWYGGLLYLTGLLIRLLRVVRDTGAGTQRVTRAYLAAAWICIASVATRLPGHWWPELSWWDDDLSTAMRCLAVAIFAAAAAISWLSKMRAYRGLLNITRTPRSARRRTGDLHAAS